MRLPRSLVLSYVLDFALCAACAVIAFLVERLPPFQRVVFLNDPSIQFPYQRKETIPMVVLPVFCIVIPLALVACTCALSKDRSRTVLVATLGLCLAVSSTYLITSILKVYIGKLRPDFISRCKPDRGSSIWNALCTGPDELLIAGRKSMPSGHTSTSVAGLGFASLVIAGQLRLFDKKGYVYKFLIVLLPWIGGVLVGLTRIRDYRHDASDVVVGMLLGTAMAYLSYICYFPLITTEKSECPYTERFASLDQEGSAWPS